MKYIYYKIKTILKILLTITSVSVIILIVNNAFAFNTKNSIVPEIEILSGGPPKDGIPAILKPKFIRPNNAGYLKKNDPVICVVINKIARAYPVKILSFHEVVNDKIKNKPFVVTY